MAAIAGIVVCLSAPLNASAGKPPSQVTLTRIVRQAFAAAGPAVETQAVCVAEHESSGPAGLLRPSAVNGGQVGLFEIDGPTWDPQRNPRALPIVGLITWSRMFDAAYNAMVAFRIWRHSGWLPAWTADKWACRL